MRNTRLIGIHLCFVAALLISPISISGPAAAAAHVPFVVALSGCAVAHCDIASTELNLLAPPTQAPVQVFRDAAIGGTFGLGCVSNGTVVACTYSPDPADTARQECLEHCLVVYDATGYILYKSGSLFTAKSHLSVPVMDPNGHLIMADNKTIARINPYANDDGAYDYMQRHDFGVPFSPTVSNGGLVVFIATTQFQDAEGAHGPQIAAWYADDLTPIGNMQIRGAQGQVYETLNTGVSGNRVYVVMSDITNDYDGILAAIEIDPFQPNPFSQPWTYAFEGPSGASPTVSPSPEGVRIYFDGMDHSDIFARALSIAVTDRGTYATETWPIRDMGRGKIMASSSLDPRGVCLWIFVTPQTKISCVNPNTGIVNPDYSINLVTLPIGTLSQTPTSPLTIANAAGPSDPIMLFGTTDATPNPLKRGYVVAVRLSNRSLLWSKPIGWGEMTFSQFPIVLAPGLGPRIAFPTNRHRVNFLGINP